MVYSIENAEIKDIKDIERLIKKAGFQLNFVSKNKNYSETLTKSSILSYILDDDSIIFVTRDEETGYIIGYCICCIYTPWAASENFKRSTVVSIQPDQDLSEFKKSKIFIELFNKYENWAKENKVDEINMTINRSKDISKFLEKKGYIISDIVLNKSLGER